MTKEQIIKKCIEIATSNGWDFEFDYYDVEDCLVDLKNTQKSEWWPLETISLYELLFNNSNGFAKALFGNKMVCRFTGSSKGIENCEPWHSTNCCCDNVSEEIPNWQFHSKHLVTCEDIFQYLEDYIKEL